MGWQMNQDRELQISNLQARQFLLLKHGLIDKHRFAGKDGVMEFVRQAGCIQYDPIDICGKNSELVLQSRVKGFRKEMLYDLLYNDRLLVDCFDKNLAILPVEDYPAFARSRQWHRDWGRSKAEIEEVKEDIKDIIRRRGPVCSSDLRMSKKVDWYWSSTKLSRAALEYLYFTGELAIHHKRGSLKYYDLAERCLPQHILKEQDPYADELVHLKWRVLRRISSIGLLWNKASDGWLNIDGLKTSERNAVFEQLLGERKILPCRVDGMKDVLYMSSQDEPLLDYIRQSPKLKARCEFIAPLDNLIWDRKLIKELFGFDYKWEIYTPEPQRKYGYYVLPILYGTSFAGRIEAVCQRKNGILDVKNIWFEGGIRQTKTMMGAMVNCMERLAQFNDAAILIADK